MTLKSLDLPTPNSERRGLSPRACKAKTFPLFSLGSLVSEGAAADGDTLLLIAI